MEEVNRKTEMSKIRARLRLDMLSNFKDIPSVEVPNIPLEWESFSPYKEDKWVLTDSDSPLDKTSCLYEMDGNGIFETHKHEYQTETITLLTPNSRVEFITEEGIYFYQYPASFTVLKGIEHALVNECNDKIMFRVDWTPKKSKTLFEFNTKQL